MAVGSLAIPVANADVLPNGYDVSCAPANDTQVVCEIAGCPRVYENYAGDVVHTRVNALPQREIGKGCNGSITETVNLASAFTYAVQGCRKHRASGDDCGAWSNYTFTPPAKAAPPPPPPVAAPAPVIPPPVVVPDPPKKVAPTNAVTMNISVSGLTANVDIASNADIPGTCSYKATAPLLPAVNKSFDLGPNGSMNFSTLAPPLFSTYHVVLSCKGQFEGKSVEFGHVETDVTATG
ncbi:hypothetical protein [Mycobacterium antarcticum]|nr:hypothetical protein [Mycolicibacterium sp. TUM20985]